jgi:diaminobutyrate-2-oxoglutarate transaminase
VVTTITLSKSLSGYGLPLAVVLLKPELDQWLPGEHNGTFRGNNHAFVTATAAIENYWKNDGFSTEIQDKAKLVTQKLKAISEKLGVTELRLKGRGLMQGLECRSGEIADKISREAFKRGLIIETAGNHGQVVKCFCPLTISEEDLRQGLDILSQSFAAVFKASALSRAS